MIVICPNCGERVLADEHDVDIQHECNSGKYVDEDDVIKGTADHNSSSSYANLNFKGFGSNKKKYTDAGIRGERSYSRTSRGNRKSTHTQRQHVEHIELV